MYTFTISNFDILKNDLDKISQRKIEFADNLKNDYELLKTIYMDNIQILFEEGLIIGFRIILFYNYQINKNFYEIIKELKIPEICELDENENNTDTKSLNLPYYISFLANEEEIKIDIFIFWIKKNFSFYDDFKSNILNDIKDDFFFTSFFFSVIENLKNFLQAPDKNILLNTLQEINEINLFKREKDSLFLMLKVYYLKKYKLNNNNNLIFLSTEDFYEENLNNLTVEENNQKDFSKGKQSFIGTEEIEGNIYPELNIINSKFEHKDNCHEINFFEKIQKRSDRLLENSNVKKNQINKITNNFNENNIKEINSSEYEQFFILGGVKGEVFTDRGSSFQAHAIKINSFDEVGKYTKILLINNKVQKATHNIMSYRFVGKENLKNEEISGKGKNKEKSKNVYNITEGFDDDGEAGAGVRLLGILQKIKIYNIFIVVSRWFGGTLLGNDRFKHINDTAKNLIMENKNKFEYENEIEK